MSKPRALKRLRERAAGLTADVDPYYKDIADQIAEQRVARDLSQAELAELCGTTQSAIARVERGVRPPRIDTLRQIANALDCKLSIELRQRTKTEGERK